MHDWRILSALTSLALATLAASDSHKVLMADETCHGLRSVHCPKCNTYCRLELKDAKEEKHGWNVQVQEICVPRVVFPWQKSFVDPSVNNGAWIKTVHVLKKHSFECPTCQYAWTRVKTCSGGAACDSYIGGGDARADSVILDVETRPDVEAQQPPDPKSVLNGGLLMAPPPPATPPASHRLITKKKSPLSFKSFRKMFSSAKKRLKEL